nr:nucleotide disphospho-sugar-binding domain-containing protein [Kutzneria buriramensis]WKX13753.1 DUF1205 domain-containing protein [Kutzneria buriramensis]
MFIAGGTPSSVFALTPLATAARDAGHEVLMAAVESVMDDIAAVGIPGVPVATEILAQLMHFDDSGNVIKVPREPRELMLHVGRSYAKMAAAELDGLLDLTRDWLPDVVVGGTMSYAAGLVAAQLEVPYVRQTWDIAPHGDTDEGAEEVLQPQLKRLGLAGLPSPALHIEICPPSLQPLLPPLGTTAAQPMRWISANRQRRLEKWMYTRPTGRRRVLLTSGTRAQLIHEPIGPVGPLWPLRSLVKQLDLAGVEVLIAAPERAAEQLGAELDGVRIGWMPLDVVAPTCDLIMHHGGGITSMTVMSAGVPQLITPEAAYGEIIGQVLSDFGCGRMLMPEQLAPGQDPAEAIAACCGEILANPMYAQQARVLADEIAGLPTPPEVVRLLARLPERSAR